MSISAAYAPFLDHLGATIPLRDLYADPAKPDAVALRHDVDHDLDVALEMAHHEHRRGVRATYFLLHTAPYWDDEDLVLRCHQLQAYGHEVGLHVNPLTEWFDLGIADVGARVCELADRLRAQGVDLLGTSAHGDRSCYRNGFINYWIWSELRGGDPRGREHRKSAEGIHVDDPTWQIAYPESEILEREDGARFPLWSVSMASAGFAYDAIHLRYDRYWTDSGGEWKRSGNPLDSDLSRGRHQVVVHPLWWRGPQRSFFALSTARCGSKWLAHFVDRATPCIGVHEWTLNHRRAGSSFVSDKRTSDDFAGVTEKPELASELIDTAARSHAKARRDVFETNVYLEPFVEQLRERLPEAVLIHVHRDGRDVVTSILNRDWYDVPGDRRHRQVPVSDWDSANQFERACWYWSFTNERLERLTSHVLSFERMTSDLDDLRTFLERLGLVVHPLLAEAHFSKALNEGRRSAFPRHTGWSERLRGSYARICGKVHQRLGYGDLEVAEGSASSPIPTLAMDDRSQRELTLRPPLLWLRRCSYRGLRVRPALRGLRIAPSRVGAGSHYLLLARGSWSEIHPEDAIRLRADSYYRGEARLVVPAGGRLRLFALFCDDRGECRARRQLMTFREGDVTAPFSFAPPRDARIAGLGLLVDALPGEGTARLASVSVERLPFPPSYRAANVCDRLSGE